MKIFSATIFLLLVISGQLSAQTNSEFEWQLKKNQDGIQVYTRSVEGSKFKAVRSVMLTDFRLSSVVALIRDGAACPRWADLCKESRVMEEISETEQIVYSYNDIPWPVKDRDAITKVIWKQDPETHVVTMTATAIDSDQVPKNNRAVRLKHAVTKWILSPQIDGQLKIVSEGHIDPAGPTPAWVTNLLLIDSPLKTMQNLRREFTTDNYAGESFEFIH